MELPAPREPPALAVPMASWDAVSGGSGARLAPVLGLTQPPNYTKTLWLHGRVGLIFILIAVKSGTAFTFSEKFPSPRIFLLGS